MPRKPRVEYPGHHHLINRGVARGNIFLKEDDFLKFLEILANTTQSYNFEVHVHYVLWQGRFKSWFVNDEHYLGTLARYIEQNPIQTNCLKKMK